MEELALRAVGEDAPEVEDLAACAAPWRLLQTGAGEPAWNMAVDQALAEAVAAGSSPPVLRLYGWEPAAVSLGYNQPVRERRPALEALHARGPGAVRRPTGGRAVLHAAEVTYSVAARCDRPPLAGGPRESCRTIHAAILAGLRALGLEDLSLYGAAPTGGVVDGRCECRPAPAALARRTSAACFATRSRTEVAWRGRKLVGSAQRRFSSALLQHGSILLSGDQSALERVWPGAAAEGGLTTLGEAGGRAFTFEEVAEAVREGFAGALGIGFEEDELREAEAAEARRLAEQRYRREEFLYRC